MMKSSNEELIAVYAINNNGILIQEENYVEGKSAGVTSEKKTDT